MCFQKDSKTAQAARCIKSRIMTMVINSVLYINTFEQQGFVLKGMFKSMLLKYHVHKIYIDQYLINNALYEHKSLENIKKVYKQAGNFDNQKQFKDIIEAAMVYTPEGLTNDIPISPITSTPVKKPSTGKSLYLFTNIFEVKKKTATRRFGAAKYKHKEIKYGTTP